MTENEKARDIVSHWSKLARLIPHATRKGKKDAEHGLELDEDELESGRLLPTSRKEQLLNFTDANGFNRLMVAAQNGDTAKVQRLLALGFDPNSSNGCDSAISLAYNNNHFDAVLALLESNAKFPDNFDAARVAGHEGVTSFVRAMHELHASLDESFAENLRKATDRYGQLKFFFCPSGGDFNRSIAFAVLSAGNDELYKLLTFRNIALAPDELPHFMQSSLASGAACHRRFKGVADDYVIALLLNTTVGDEGACGVGEEKRYELVRDAFAFLNAIDSFRPVLEFVKHSGALALEFDFARDTNEALHADGKHSIVIGAEKLLDESAHSRRVVCGEIIKKLTQLAVARLYRNEGLPYAREDRQRAARFEAILRKCGKNRACDKLVHEVLSRPPHVAKVKLVSRVPQIIAQLSHKEETLSERRRNFAEIFEFFDEIVADLRRANEEAKRPVIMTLERRRAEIVRAEKEKKKKKLLTVIVQLAAIFLLSLLVASVVLFSSGVDVTAPEDCGKVYANKVGGLISGNGSMNSYPGQWPWLVPIFFKMSVNGSVIEQFTCGSSLITEVHLLTAAHCIAEKANPADYFVLLGRHNIKNASETNWVRREISRIFAHLFYVDEGVQHRSRNDIAVMRMASKVTFSHFIQPVCLPARSARSVEATGFVAGYGKHSAAVMYVEQPKYTQLRSIGEEECLRSREEYKLIVSENSFCAGDTEAVPCAGDSGGGFVVRDDTSYRYVVTGIVSQTLNTVECRPNDFVVFVDVAKYREWIDEQIKKK